MKHLKKIAAIAIVGSLALTGCAGNSEYQERKQSQKTTTLKNSLGKSNLQERLKREEDPSAIRYLYLMSFGEVVGYYVTKGKISSSSGQLAPEDEIVDPCASSYCPTVVDSARDDGTYGPGDPGIFFFTTDGVMVETDLDYIQSDEPLPIDVPRFGGNKSGK